MLVLGTSNFQGATITEPIVPRHKHFFIYLFIFIIITKLQS